MLNGFLADDMCWAEFLKAISGGEKLLSVVTWKRKSNHSPDKCSRGKPAVIDGWLDVKWFRVIGSQKVPAIRIRFGTEGCEVQELGTRWEKVSHEVPTEIENSGS